MFHVSQVMNPLASVESMVARTAKRLRWMRGWTGLWQGAVVGAAAYLLALGVYKLLPIPREWVFWFGWLALAAPGLGLVWGFRRTTSALEAARWLDERQRLQQRLSTALELGSQPSGTWRELVVADASSAAERINPRQLLPLVLPRLARVVVLLLALTVTLGFVPAYRTKAQVQASKDAEVIKEVGRELAQLTKRTLEQRPVLAEPTRKNLEEVKELGDRLAQVKLSRDDTLKDLAKVTDQLRQQATDLARNPALRKMEKAARTPGGNSQPTQAQLQKQMEALQKQLGDKAPDADGAKELQKELDQLKEAAKGLADTSSPEGQAARQQLSQMTSDLAQKAESMGFSLPSLDEALEALKSAEIDQFLKDLDVADIDLEKMADFARQMAQLQQQAEKLGKDLAEQLKNAQTHAAIDSLRRLQELLKQPGLSEEQKQALSQEIENAIKPGEHYGQVGEHLTEALKMARAGQQSSACQSLAAAQKELEDLLKGLGDMQALMAAMEGLRKAQMCVGNCQSWGMCRSDASSWALLSETSQTGIGRGIQNAQNRSDRDPSLPDNLAPTKIKGQIQPGGPMPSITLKGLSIKGESKVAYTEAVQAAQSDAQAALSQEQVPKAYRNSVRDYFDDLKD